MNDTTISINSITENIKAFVRLRPLNDKEKELGAGCIKINEDSTMLAVENKTDNRLLENKAFALDSVFSEDVTQEEIFEKVTLPNLKAFFLGYNCTIFAYGQTGAGKTHTMLGPLDSLFENSNNHKKHGLIPRILNFIFNSEK